MSRNHGSVQFALACLFPLLVFAGDRGDRTTSGEGGTLAAGTYVTDEAILIVQRDKVDRRNLIQDRVGDRSKFVTVQPTDQILKDGIGKSLQEMGARSVRFSLKSGDDLFTTNRQTGEEVDMSHLLDWVLVKLPENADYREFEHRLSSIPGVDRVSPNRLAKPQATYPNDPYSGSGDSWHIGHIGLYEAWDSFNGFQTIQIGAYDASEVDGDHDDLTQILHDDSVTDTFYVNSNDVGDHGTRTAGVCCAETDNNDFIAGVSYESELPP